MNKRQLGLTALGLAVVVAGTGFLVAQSLPPADRIQVVAEPSSSAGTEPTPGSPATPLNGSASPAPLAPPTDAEAEADADTEFETGPSTETGPRTSTEVLPTEPEPVVLPPSKPRTALVSLPLPPAASSRGEIVDGYPLDVMPNVPDSSVEHSSVVTEGDRLQAALEARTTAGTADILAFYRQHFAPLGLLESPTTSAKRSSTLSFARGDDSVTLSVTAVAGGSTYVLFGVFTAQG